MSSDRTLLDEEQVKAILRCSTRELVQLEKERTLVSIRNPEGARLYDREEVDDYLRILEAEMEVSPLDHRGRDDGDASFTIMLAAKELGVHHTTIRRWRDSGKLPSYKDARGVHRIPMEAVRRLRAEHDLMNRGGLDRGEPTQTGGTSGTTTHVGYAYGSGLRLETQIHRLEGFYRTLSVVPAIFQDNEKSSKRGLKDLFALLRQDQTLNLAFCPPAVDSETAAVLHGLCEEMEVNLICLNEKLDLDREMKLRELEKMLE